MTSPPSSSPPRRARPAIAAAALAALLAATHIIAAARPQTAPAVNLIAYVDAQGVIRTMRPDGTGDARATPETDAYYTWPVWSPDARTLAYSGVVPDPNGDLSLNLYAAPIGRAANAANPSANAVAAPKTLYAGPPGEANLIAQGVPHYALWSPDSASLAFIATDADGILSLFIDDLSDDPTARHVLDGGPLWMSWAQDAAALAVHRAADHFIVKTPRNPPDQAQAAEPEIAKLSAASQAYRVPAWRPSAPPALTLATQDELGVPAVSAFSLADGKLQSPKALHPTRGEAAFLWSPDGARIAVADAAQYFIYRGAPITVYGRLAVIPYDDPDAAAEIPDAAIAFFWSPDATKLAYLSPAQSEGALRWSVYDAQSGERYPLMDFIPSQEQQTMLRFFDQYAYSHSLWSPDSADLVFAGKLISQSVTASAAAHPGHPDNHIIVVSAGPAAAPSLIAEGVLGFWSPR